MKRIATHGHRSKYPNPISIEVGDTVTVERRDTDAYPGWVWARTADGNAGWAPELCLEPASERTARATQAYTARELDTEVGDALVVLRELNGWCWVRNDDGGEGWVPMETIR